MLDSTNTTISNYECYRRSEFYPFQVQSFLPPPTIEKQPKSNAIRIRHRYGTIKKIAIIVNTDCC